MKNRLDQELVARGLFASRAKAQEAIALGCVVVDGAVARKPGAPVSHTAVIAAPAPYPWVSRGGAKLAAALDRFGVDPSGRACLDLGASTGGFTQVLLARGAVWVVAVDVGHGQLAPSLAGDPRVAAHEGLDARALTRDHVPPETDLIVADLSFIGLSKALPAALGLVSPRSDLIALVKPQFESGPERRGGAGAPTDEAARAIAARAVSGLQGVGGFASLGLIDSPMRGGAGALEFFLHARRAG